MTQKKKLKITNPQNKILNGERNYYFLVWECWILSS